MVPDDAKMPFSQGDPVPRMGLLWVHSKYVSIKNSHNYYRFIIEYCCKVLRMFPLHLLSICKFNDAEKTIQTRSSTRVRPREVKMESLYRVLSKRPLLKTAYFLKSGTSWFTAQSIVTSTGPLDTMS